MFFTLLALTSMFYMGHAAMPGPYTCPLTLTPPVIDGDYSDWGSTWLGVDSITGSTTGCTARMQMEYDANNLYVVFDIKDSTMGDTASSFATWAMDCNELELSMDTTTSNSSTPGGIRTGMYQFRHVEGRTEKLTDGTSWGNDIPIVSTPALQRWNAIANFKLKELDASDGYVVEWQLPWDSLSKNMDTTHITPGVLQPWNKKNFKLDVQVADNTGTAGRTEQLFWAGTSNNCWNNSAYQEVVNLQFPLGVAKAQMKNQTLNVSVIKNTLEINTTVANASIYDVTGKLVLKLQNTSSADISRLSSGLYILKTSDQSVKFIKR